ncbi:MAG: hypothetical protein JXB07_08825 [Anaerolineae bacterium]|nr:hypothetical protein [Anaerolineae bacterium]
MDEHPLTRILSKLAEDGIPDDLDLRATVHHRLETSKTQPEKGDFPMKASSVRVRYIIATAALVMTLLSAVLLFTPQGRAWAQTVLGFFTRAESDVLPVETPVPGTDTPDTLWIFNLSISEVEQQAGFDVLEPAWLPEGLAFTGALYEAESHMVRVSYSLQDFGTNGVNLTEEPIPEGSEECELCGQVVGASALIETVPIGDVMGQYVPGVWQADDAGQWNWVSDPYLQTLRWQVHGMAFELLAMAPSDIVTKADLIAMAESIPVPPDAGQSLATATAPTPTCGSWAKPICTLAEAQQQVDFTVQMLPESAGLQLKGAYAEPGLVLLRYSDAVDLFQMRPERRGDASLVGASAQIEPVQIGETQGEYVQGVWLDSQDSPVSEWQNEGSQSLRWQQNGMFYILNAYRGDSNKEQMAEWASSLVAYSASDRPDLTHIRQLSETEALVGYPITPLDSAPEGYIFTHASIHQPTRSVCLHYMYDGNDGPGPYLLLAQGPADMAPALIQTAGAAPSQPRAATIGGAEQSYSLDAHSWERSGEWACTSADTRSNYDESYLTLTWQIDQRQYDLYTPVPFGRCLFRESFSELDLLRLAETVTGISTHPSDEFDPACTQDIDQMEAFAGFDIKVPAWMPDGLILRGASSWKPGEGVMLYYSFPDDNHTAVTIGQNPIPVTAGADLLDDVKDVLSGGSEKDDFPAEGYRRLTVNGAPAVMILGCWLSDENGNLVWYQEPDFLQTLWWKKDGMLFAVYGLWSSNDGIAAQTNLVSIAESMR